jgi:hypothetical protein
MGLSSGPSVATNVYGGMGGGGGRKKWWRRRKKVVEEEEIKGMISQIIMLLAWSILQVKTFRFSARKTFQDGPRVAKIQRIEHNEQNMMHIIQ